jgi:hypothetical protein
MEPDGRQQEHADDLEQSSEPRLDRAGAAVAEVATVTVRSGRCSDVATD